MSSAVIPVDIFDLMIFGGVGGLSMRKRLSALFHRDASGQISVQLRIIGVALDKLTFLFIAKPKACRVLRKLPQGGEL